MRSSAERLCREITRIVHEGLGFPELADRAGCIIRREFGADGACWLSFDPATLLPTGHVAQHSMRAEDFPLLVRNELMEEDVNKFVVLNGSDAPSGALCIATEAVPERSARFRTILAASGVSDELRVVLRDDARCWGAVVLYRRGEAPPFSEGEIDVAAQLSPLLAEGMRKGILLRAVERGGGPEAPGVVVLSAGNEMESLTEQARFWLDCIVDAGSDASALPVIIFSVAELARSLVTASGEKGRLARARVPIRNGRWLTVHASVLGPPEEGRVAVIIDPTPSPDIAPLIAEAYRLSRRENDVTALVLQGMSTAQIAEHLHVTAYTVQDHLKSIFNKVGVRSRGELASQLFFSHYVPQLTNSFETPAGSRVTWTHGSASAPAN